jgi:pseudouridine-5'-phosphate glycosidase
MNSIESNMYSEIYIAPEVSQALQGKRAVVALESTLITHGLPYPANIETALAMEAAVRESGAFPATIAILKGKIHVGLTAEEIEYLATKPAGSVRKCSRRDFAIALGLKQDAATTVAGTMIVAHKAGIRVFATGGIGGVHRGHPFDVSADLIELGRTAVTVVCAGAKSILDLPLTLEVLETQGVPVIGFGTDTLPAFYTRSSGLPLDACIETPEQAAQIIASAIQFGAEHGILITVPVPVADELDPSVAEKAIQQATEEANANNIHGKGVTPFVLQRVMELTDGESRRANVALLVNNARIGGQIAVALQNMMA